jgi:hypothetical protein
LTDEQRRDATQIRVFATDSNRSVLKVALDLATPQNARGFGCVTAAPRELP